MLVTKHSLHKPLKSTRSPNGIRFHSKRLNGLQKAVLASSASAMGFWLYPLARSRVENQRAPERTSKDSSM